VCPLIDRVSREENIDERDLCKWLLDRYEKGNLEEESYKNMEPSAGLKWFLLGDFDVEFHKYKDMSSYELEKANGEAHGMVEFCKQVSSLMTLAVATYALLGPFIKCVYDATNSAQVLIESLNIISWGVRLIFITSIVSWGWGRKASLKRDAIQFIQKQRKEAETKEEYEGKTISCD